MSEEYKRSEWMKEALRSEQDDRLSHSIEKVWEKKLFPDHQDRLADNAENSDRSSSEFWLKKLLSKIKGVENLLKKIRENSSTLFNENFDILYRELVKAVDLFQKDLLEYTDFPYWRSREREDAFPSYEPKRDIRRASESEFFRECAVQWRVGKEDVARFLTIASQSHNERVLRGEIRKDTPLQIVDVGGANAALAALIADVAKELEKEVRITIVDPDKKVIAQAKEIYGDEFIFESVDVDTFLDSVYVSNPEILEMLSKRRRLIKEFEKKYEDISAVKNKVFRSKEGEVIIPTHEELQKYAEMLMSLDVIKQEDIAGMDDAQIIEFLDESSSNDYTPINQRYLFWSIDAIISFTHDIERKMLEIPARYDLVINSWMPHGVDFTASIRLLNGAAIAYAFARDGSTGIQSSDSVHMQAAFYNEITVPGQERSYNPGISYILDSGWVTPAVKDIIPFANGILIETRKGFECSLGDNRPRLQPKGEEYPWNKKMPTRPEPFSMKVNGDKVNNGENGKKFDFQLPFKEQAGSIPRNTF